MTTLITLPLDLVFYEPLAYGPRPVRSRTQKLTDVIKEYTGIPAFEHVDSVSVAIDNIYHRYTYLRVYIIYGVANGVLYEHGSVQTPAIMSLRRYLKPVNKLSVRSQQHRHMFELQLPLDLWHGLIPYLQVDFLPQRRQCILVCKYDVHKQHSL